MSSVFDRLFGPAFTTIQVPFGTSPVAQDGSDILTFTSSDSSVIITGNATTDTIDLRAIGGGGGSLFSFVTMQVPHGTSPVADSPLDTLTFTSVDGSITITGNATTDTIDLQAEPVTSNYVEMTLQFKEAFHNGDTYSEITRVDGEITQINIWATSGKVDKLFSKVIVRTNGVITSIHITDNQTGAVLETTLTRTAGEITAITKNYT